MQTSITIDQNREKLSLINNYWKRQQKLHYKGQHMVQGE